MATSTHLSQCHTLWGQRERRVEEKIGAGRSRGAAKLRSQKYARKNGYHSVPIRCTIGDASAQSVTFRCRFGEHTFAEHAFAAPRRRKQRGTHIPSSHPWHFPGNSNRGLVFVRNGGAHPGNPILLLLPGTACSHLPRSTTRRLVEEEIGAGRRKRRGTHIPN